MRPFKAAPRPTVGFALRRDNNHLDCDRGTRGIIRIAYVEPNGPAAAAGFRRGMVLASVDGVPTACSIPAAQFDKLFASEDGAPSAVGVQDFVDGPVRNLTVAPASFSTTPVLVDRVLLDTPTPGYLAYTSFAAPIGEVQLADAFERFTAAGVTELVVDLRYNGGGYLDIAAELGYMVAGQIQTRGRIFETLAYNDKRTADNASVPFWGAITPFFGNDARAGEPLAALNLRRVYVLATGSTCSASESFISGLRGIDVEVVMIGGTTCGKPYGFSQANNCTLAFFALEFEGRNDQGAVTPVTGLAPTCGATDDFDHDLGDPAERMLAFALSHRRTGSCPAFQAAPAVARSLPADGAQASATLRQDPDALNPDMEFTTRSTHPIKLYRAAR